LFFVLFQKYVKSKNKSSEIISTIRAKIDTNPALRRGINWESPTIITDSLTPKPIGVIIERYPTRRENTKNAERENINFGDIGTIEITVR